MLSEKKKGETRRALYRLLRALHWCEATRGAYYMSWLTPVAYSLFVAVSISCLATYILFDAGFCALLKLSFAEGQKTLLSTSEFYFDFEFKFRMRKNAADLASICIYRDGAYFIGHNSRIAEDSRFIEEKLFNRLFSNGIVEDTYD